jgi:hypothetical protein
MPNHQSVGAREDIEQRFILLVGQLVALGDEPLEIFPRVAQQGDELTDDQCCSYDPKQYMEIEISPERLNLNYKAELAAYVQKKSSTLSKLEILAAAITETGGLRPDSAMELAVACGDLSNLVHDSLTQRLVHESIGFFRKEAPVRLRQLLGQIKNKPADDPASAPSVAAIESLARAMFGDEKLKVPLELTAYQIDQLDGLDKDHSRVYVSLVADSARYNLTSSSEKALRDLPVSRRGSEESMVWAENLVRFVIVNRYLDNDLARVIVKHRALFRRSSMKDKAALLLKQAGRVLSRRRWGTVWDRVKSFWPLYVVIGLVIFFYEECQVGSQRMFGG